VKLSTTTVLVLVRPISNRLRVEGILRWAVLVSLACGLEAAAQERPVHWIHAGAMPPGAIGSLRLHRGGPLSGYFQPVRIRAPEGARISLAEEGGFASSHSNDVLVGMQIGPVYRLQVVDFSAEPGREVYPTVEIIDRLYPPQGLALRYPIPIELTKDELDMAADGMFVTRVIYLENPNQALPVDQPDEQQWVEAPRGADPLVVADEIGRPVAILRIGARTPTSTGVALDACPPPLQYYNAP
jgi:hypothetical protein